MSERKASGQPSLVPWWAWRGLAGLSVALGIVMIIYSFSTERWTSAVWYGVLTVGLGALFLRGQRWHNMGSRPAAHSEHAWPGALSWDDPRLKRGAAIFVLVCAGIGLLGVVVGGRGAGMGAAQSGQDRRVDLIGGLLFAFIGFGAAFGWFGGGAAEHLCVGPVAWPGQLNHE
jgi:hypothetical protein